MCSERFLQILICVTAVLSSSNGFPDKDRLSVAYDRLRKVEMDYGERLSSKGRQERATVLRSHGSGKGPQRLERLIGKVKPVPKVLNQEKTQSTKCTTSQPISVDLDDLKNSDEDSKSQGSMTDAIAVTIPGGDHPPLVTPPDANMDNDGEKDFNNIGSDENKVQSDKGEGLNEDPAKDDDDDAILSTKKYFGPKASYVPDHYLDDARK